MPKKLRGWRRKQIQRKKRKKLRIIGLVLIVILIIFLGWFGFKIYRSITRSIWDGQNQFNLAISSHPVFVASFNPAEKSLNVMLIPQGTFIETIHGYGPCRVESIYRLGELSNKGGELFQGSLQEYLGIPVDAYASEHRTDNIEQRTKETKEFIVKMIGNLLRDRGETNLTKWDLIRLWWEFKNLRQDKITLVDLGQTSVSQQVDLPDGTKANKIDTERLESIMSQFFIDKKIKEEDLTVSVLNGTNHLGLANKVATLIKNIGGQVVGVGEIENFKSQISNLKCQIRSQKKDKNTYTVQKLMKIFGCQWGGEDLENQRSELVLIIEEGYWEKLALP